MKLRRVPQPPMDPAHRAREHHEFWPGFIAAVVGGVLLFCGARHLTGVETVAGERASETQLMKAYSFGGLQFADQAVTPPPDPNDPAALERWARKNAAAAAPTWKVRVDTEAKTPCPT